MSWRKSPFFEAEPAFVVHSAWESTLHADTQHHTNASNNRQTTSASNELMRHFLNGDACIESIHIDLDNQPHAAEKLQACIGNIVSCAIPVAGKSEVASLISAMAAHWHGRWLLPRNPELVLTFQIGTGGQQARDNHRQLTSWRTAIAMIRSPRHASTDASASRDMAEHRLVRHWAAVLQCEKLVPQDCNDRFFESCMSLVGSTSPSSFHDGLWLASFAKGVALVHHAAAVVTSSDQQTLSLASYPIRLTESVVHAAAAALRVQPGAVRSLVGLLRSDAGLATCFDLWAARKWLAFVESALDRSMAVLCDMNNSQERHGTNETVKYIHISQRASILDGSPQDPEEERPHWIVERCTAPVGMEHVDVFESLLAPFLQLAEGIASMPREHLEVWCLAEVPPVHWLAQHHRAVRCVVGRRVDTTTAQLSSVRTPFAHSMSDVSFAALHRSVRGFVNHSLRPSSSGGHVCSDGSLDVDETRHSVLSQSFTPRIFRQWSTLPPRHQARLGLIERGARFVETHVRQTRPSCTPPPPDPTILIDAVVVSGEETADSCRIVITNPMFLGLLFAERRHAVRCVHVPVVQAWLRQRRTVLMHLRSRRAVRLQHAIGVVQSWIRFVLSNREAVWRSVSWAAEMVGRTTALEHSASRPSDLSVDSYGWTSSGQMHGAGLSSSSHWLLAQRRVERHVSALESRYRWIIVERESAARSEQLLTMYQRLLPFGKAQFDECEAREKITGAEMSSRVELVVCEESSLRQRLHVLWTRSLHRAAARGATLLQRIYSWEEAYHRRSVEAARDQEWVVICDTNDIRLSAHRIQIQTPQSAATVVPLHASPAEGTLFPVVGEVPPASTRGNVRDRNPISNLSTPVSSPVAAQGPRRTSVPVVLRPEILLVDEQRNFFAAVQRTIERLQMDELVHRRELHVALLLPELLERESVERMLIQRTQWFHASKLKATIARERLGAMEKAIRTYLFRLWRFQCDCFVSWCSFEVHEFRLRGVLRNLFLSERRALVDSARTREALAADTYTSPREVVHHLRKEQAVVQRLLAALAAEEHHQQRRKATPRAADSAVTASSWDSTVTVRRYPAKPRGL